ncbi:NusG domain II-containing protein [Paenibacillus anaericanus]|uniref:NusG domain II-containing protein n=1 Tax=Paenibacillus anaericanus TaxID=170367 RepID=A0A3S1BR47_9BACL|nr:NusG domain II-containing protein [Paenibacillus anaericanus]RUT45564.1 NusG domain II-containing protein [Paenibacillus anaericanus]
MIVHKFKKGDIVLIAVILLFALIFMGIRWLQDTDQSYINGNYSATIKIDNEIYKTVELTTETQYVEIRNDRGYDILKIRDNGIEVVESDCPQKICFTFGLITKPRETIICIPMRMVIEINGTPVDTDNEIDVIVQ